MIGLKTNKTHGATVPRKTTMKHHKYHQHYQVKAAKLHARAEAALDLLTAIVIGVALAACLFYGWSA
jgi:hypothetical protein